mgnify:CR=1 FL=1
MPWELSEIFWNDFWREILENKKALFVSHSDKTEKINSKIKNHSGEIVLLVANWEEHLGCTGFGHKPTNYFLKELLFLGILEGDKLITKKEKGFTIHALPTRRYVKWDGSKVKVFKGNIVGTFPWPFYEICLNVDRPLQLTNPIVEKKIYEMELKIGNEAIEWFEEKGKRNPDYLIFIKRATKILGKKIESSKINDLLQKFREEIENKLNRLKEQRKKIISEAAKDIDQN